MAYGELQFLVSLLLTPILFRCSFKYLPIESVRETLQSCFGALGVKRISSVLLMPFLMREVVTPLNSGSRVIWIPIIGLIFAMLLWGSSFIAMKVVLGECSPSIVLLGRMLIASGIFLLLRNHFGKFSYRRGDWKFLVLMTLCEPCLYFTFEAKALKYTTASEAATITALLPLMTMLIARFFLAESVSLRSWMGLAVALSGTLCLSLLGQTTETAPNPILGNLLEFLAMVCAAGYTISCRYLSERYSPLLLTAIQSFSGSFFFMPTIFCDGGFSPGRPTLPTLLTIIYLGAVVNVLAYFLYNFGLSKIPASQVSPYVNLIPVFSMMMGWLILNEQLSSFQYFAATLVLGGTLFCRTDIPSNAAKKF